jgi:hypothetical protein
MQAMMARVTQEKQAIVNDKNDLEDDKHNLERLLNQAKIDIDIYIGKV